MKEDLIKILSDFLPSVEGFSGSVFWDFKQWTWGYGTAAGFDKNKKPTGTITKAKALADTLAHCQRDYAFLVTKIKVALNNNQWAAFLSFSYNEGVGNAVNLVSDINVQSPGLEEHFKKYIYAGKKKDEGLVSRRNKEWVLFCKKTIIIKK